MSTGGVVLVFIGSFDPVHRGHIEAAEKALERCPSARNVVFLPNNTRKGKPGRAPLPLRAHWLSFWMPLHNTLRWLGNAEDKLVCDTRDCDRVLSEIKAAGYRIVGLVGSDIDKQPKWLADEWIIVERVGVPFSDVFKEIESAGIPVCRIPAAECQWQHLSSSQIRKECASENALHKSMEPFVKKRFQGTTLSSNTIAHEKQTIDGQNAFKITFVDAYVASTAVKNVAILTQDDHVTRLFKVATVLRTNDKEVFFSFMEGQTLFELLTDFLELRIDETTFMRIFTAAFRKVQSYYHSPSVTFPRYFHTDPSIKNILFDNANFTFALVDYEKVRWLTEQSQVEKYYCRFLSSAEFYMVLHGFEASEKINALLRACEERATKISK